MLVSKRVRAAAVVLALAAGACGADDGATVTSLNDTTSDSASAGASAGSSASASASAPSTGGDTALVAGDGGYEYASNVDAHRLVVLDVCAIKELLPKDAEIDYAAVDEIYTNGGNSVNSDGSIRTIAGFAARDDRNPAHQEHFGSATPLDDFVRSAIDGTGVFAGEPDLVRRQGVEKGIQNQVMVAWTIHELNAAMEKAADGNFDADEGAPHNWDEAWAFYHGADGACGPYGTGNSRAANFGTTGDDGATAVANDMILAAMIDGRDMLLDGDAEAAEAAASEALKGLAIIYSQATLRYAQSVDDDLAAGDVETARVHQTEGWAFSRVMAPQFAELGADTDAIDAFYNLANEPTSDGYAIVEEALQPVWDSLGITSSDIGALS